MIGSIGFDRTNRQLAVSAEAAQSPRDIYVYGIQVCAQQRAIALPEVKLARWTQSEIGPIDRA